MSEVNGLPLVEKFNPPALAGVGGGFAEEMDGLQFSFDRVKIPSGGGISFEVPGDDPDVPDSAKELVGVIIDHYPVNAYWAEKYSGQNNPPDCASLDGKHGSGPDCPEGRACNSCPLNAWGSADDGNGGKACKNMRRIYILAEGSVFPYLVTLPPTSIKNFGDYMAKRILAKGLRSNQVITKITLRKETSKGGITYSQASFSLAGMLPEEEAAQVAQYANSIKPMTRNVEILVDESNGNNKDLESMDMEEVM